MIFCRFNTKSLSISSAFNFAIA